MLPRVQAHLAGSKEVPKGVRISKRNNGLPWASLPRRFPRAPTERGHDHRPPARKVNVLVARINGAAAGLIGLVAGITPHVLHHIGLIAGTAVLTGAEGSVLFGIIGFAFTLPMLFRLKRRFGTWMAPGVALALFLGMFTVSTLWIGPAIRGSGGPTDAAPVDPHHLPTTSVGPTIGRPYPAQEY